MIYTATLTCNAESQTVSLGECIDTAHACSIAETRCPFGWAVSDVRPESQQLARDGIREYLRTIGAKGGRATGPRKARGSEAMRAAALKRWAKRKG